MLFNTILLALRDIRRNVMRSVLTILGIIIGVGAVITLVTIGNGTTAQVTGQIASMGTNVLMISPGQHRGPGQDSAAPSFTLQDVQAIRKEIGSLKAVAPVVSANATAVAGNKNWSTSITGSSNDFFIVRNWIIESGRTFEQAELLTGRAVCVVGQTVRKNLFAEDDPVGKNIRLGKVSCQVIGQLQEKGQSSMGRDQDDLIVMPLLTVQRRFSGNRDVAGIQLSVEDSGSTEQATEELIILLRKRRHLADSEEDNFNVRDTKELAAMLTGTTKTMTALLSAVAAVSLLVGGIGIMNIMLVSVTERTREIGIRLAIGAFEHEVMLQFLTESVVLSSLGGIVGIIIALISSYGITLMLELPFLPDFQIIIIAFLFSAAVGVIFGYFPALKAARLDPIDALRHE
ncbi:MAG: putative ABC transport system permease protein [Candidatus Electronema aureum]|uniref:ABC transport system permease protein n=1 Tax=Candidatus Electronema aureum TaxID=2005002 RepID=A0A521FYM8_9BACT|nr:MAG: putative ABC transport system permease protein [Candidatus Electronema aureum]